MKFIIIGFFRSGTTFLSNILNSHPDLHSVSDPFIILIKSFRNKILKFEKKNWDKDLENFIFPLEKKKIIKINSSSFLRKLTNKDIVYIHNKILVEKKYQHPNIDKIPQPVNCTNYKELLIYYLKNFHKISGQKKKYLGTKISWCEEYIPAFNKSFKNLKIICIVRNINDVITSGISSINYSNTFPSAVRPILYYLMYWKKSIKYIKKNQKKVHLIKYENLVNDYKNEKKKLFNFLNVRNPKTLKLSDQYGNVWYNNSSYKNNSSLILGAKVSKNLLKKRGKVKLDNKLKNVIEHLCFKELKFLGYEVKKNKYKNSELIKIIKTHDKKFNFPKKFHYYLKYKKILNNLKY